MLTIKKFDTLTNNVVLNKCQMIVDNIIHLCCKHGAYIAGGAASEMFREILKFSSPGTFERLLLNGKSDVDIFVRKETNINNFIDDLRNYFSLDSYVELPHTIKFMCDGIKFQIITSVRGLPTDVIRGFDIVNSMVAVDNEFIIYDKSIDDLFATSTLDVANIHDLTYTRLRKAAINKSYKFSNNLNARLDIHARNLAFEIFGDLPVLRTSNNEKALSNVVIDKQFRCFVEQHAFNQLNDCFLHKKFSWKKYIASPNVKGVAADAVTQLLRKRMAFLSGGFAHDAAFEIIANNDVTSLSTRYNVPIKMYDRANYRETPDFDVYFVSKWDKERGLRYLHEFFANKQVNVRRTKNSIEFDCGDGLVQIVDYIVGTPEHILSTFDFKNCMAACLYDEFLIHYDAFPLIKNRILEAGDHHAPTPYRITKYLKNKGYKEFGPKLKKLIVNSELTQDHPLGVPLIDWDLIYHKLYS